MIYASQVMKKNHVNNSYHSCRTVKSRQLWFPIQQKAILAIKIICLFLICILSGLAIDLLDPKHRGRQAEAAGIAQMEIERAIENDRIQIVEQINLQAQLQVERAKNESLKVELSEQQSSIDNVQNTVLNALMSNLTDKMVSRSDRTTINYTTEIKNLISLNNKLIAFKKTETAKKIDLTEYEELLTNRLSHLPTLKPVPGALAGYGNRKHPIFRYSQFHPAADMPNKTGTPVKAAGSGKVIEAGYNSSRGNYIVINHGNGFTTTYMHNSKLYVSKGDTVQKRDKIAAVGNTGNSTGSHLHFEVRLYGEPVDPKSIVLES